MKFVSKCLFFLLAFISGSTASWGVPDTVTRIQLGQVRLSGPADSPNYPMGTVISNSGSMGISICNNPALSYTLSRIEYAPVAVWTGDSYSAGSAFRPFFLYESSVNGLNFGPWIRGDLFTSGITGNGVLNPAPPEPLVVWTGNRPNSARGMPTYARVYIYKGRGRLENNTYLAEQPLYRFTCYDNNNVMQETSTISTVPQVININVTGCTPSTKITTVDMAGVPIANIENAGANSLINTRQQTFSLACDPNVWVRYAVVDLNDPTNNTTTSTLTPDSTAEGVGYAITSPAGTRIQFGPDGSAPGIPGQTQYGLGPTGGANSNNPMSLQLGFSYVRKPEEIIKTGTAKSLIGITYSYQ